jgi:hypothetical membrane protein
MANKNVLLAAIVVIVFAAYLWPWYNFAQPEILGIPFFYAWVILMYVVTTMLLLVYTQAVRDEKEPGQIGGE